MKKIRKLNWEEFSKIMREAYEDKILASGIIVYKASNWEKHYTEKERSYMVFNTANYFNPMKHSLSLVGNCLDGNDDGVRLDLQDWDIDYCYTDGGLLQGGQKW